MINPDQPALVFAPMDGITDAAMRGYQGEHGAFSYAVTEFIRVSVASLPPRVFRRDVLELASNCKTKSGLPVQVQLLGGDPGRMARSAEAACLAGARAIDINFGCPAPVVNRNDGGASLLKDPDRIRLIVSAVRASVPAGIPVSAKLRLGWDSIEAIHRNAEMAAEGGASWLTIHCRTKTQGYSPPVFWRPLARVKSDTGLPVIANGDIWTLDDFKRCADESACLHFMLGRSALADPWLTHKLAEELKIAVDTKPPLTGKAPCASWWIGKRIALATEKSMPWHALSSGRRSRAISGALRDLSGSRPQPRSGNSSKG